MRGNTSWHEVTVTICSQIKQLILQQYLTDYLWLALAPEYLFIFFMPALILISATDWLITIAWWLAWSLV